MKLQRVLVALAVVNLGLLLFLLTQLRPVEAQSVAPVLRGRALEIVDRLARLRADRRDGPPSRIMSGEPVNATRRKEPR